MHPSRNYIRFTALKAMVDGEQDSFTIERTNYYLRKLGLPALDPDDPDPLQGLLDDLYSGIPENLQFYNRSHRPTREYMRDQKLHPFWAATKEMEEAKQLFMYPAVKEAVQLLLTGRLHPPDIAVRLPRKFNLTFSPKALALFAHFFWDVTSLSGDMLGALLYGSQMRPHYMACHSGSRDQALWRAGFSPKVDTNRALQEAFRSLFFRLEATRSLPDTNETARTVTAYTKELVAVHHAINGEGAGVEEQVAQLRKKIQMDTSGGSPGGDDGRGAKVIPIERVAKAGNYSGSGR